MKFNLLKYTAFLWMLVAVACDPMEETYNELDEKARSAKTDQESADIAFKLEEADYDLLEGVEGAENAVRFQNFDSEDAAKQFIPVILQNKFPYLGAGSFATVTYDFYRGRNQEVRTYTRADYFELDSANYAAIDSLAGVYGFLNSTFSSEMEISGTLTANIQAPEDGDVVLTSYEFADIDYSNISSAILIDNTFDEEVDFTYETVSLEGTQEWRWSSFSGNGYAGMSGYSGGNNPNEDWLVLPTIDLSGYNDASMMINQTLNFLGGGTIGEDIVVLIATDYTGDVTTANWTALNADVWPAGNNWTPVDSEFILNDYIGDQVNIAFKYISTADYAPNWQISSINIVAGEPINTVSVEEYYRYNAGDTEWNKVEETVAYYLQASDYDVMGEPGRYNNFSSSAEPEDYLPTFLAQKYPYAQEGDEIILVYKYYDGEVKTYGDHFTFSEGKWNHFQTVIEQTLTLANDGQAWVPDNTIKIELTGADYDIIQSLEGGARGDNVAQYDNFYQGSNTTGSTYWSNDDINEILSAYLADQYPDAEVGQKYLMVYAVYVGGGVTEMRETKFIKNESGVYILFEE